MFSSLFKGQNPEESHSSVFVDMGIPAHRHQRRLLDTSLDPHGGKRQSPSLKEVLSRFAETSSIPTKCRFVDS